MGGGQLEQIARRLTKSDLKTSRKGDAPCARASEECFNNSLKHEVCDICGWPEEEKQEERMKRQEEAECSSNELPRPLTRSSEYEVNGFNVCRKRDGEQRIVPSPRRQELTSKSRELNIH